MKRRFLFALLAMLAGNVFAGGWILVRYAETEPAIHYFESVQMRKMGDTAFVWDLHDSRRRQSLLMDLPITPLGMQSNTNVALANAEYSLSSGLKNTWVKV